MPFSAIFCSDLLPILEVSVLFNFASFCSHLNTDVNVVLKVRAEDKMGIIFCILHLLRKAREGCYTRHPKKTSHDANPTLFSQAFILCNNKITLVITKQAARKTQGDPSVLICLICHLPTYMQCENLIISACGCYSSGWQGVFFGIESCGQYKLNGSRQIALPLPFVSATTFLVDFKNVPSSLFDFSWALVRHSTSNSTSIYF